MKTALVLGAGGFIGCHMVERLKKKGYWVRGVDLKQPEFCETSADEFIVGDLRDISVVQKSMFSPFQRHVPDSINSFDEVYQFAADMGGMGFLSTGENDSDIMHNSGLINIHVSNNAYIYGAKKVFYSSSACIYPKGFQESTENVSLKESMAWPADPESPYGVEKIFSEVLYDSFNRNKGLEVRIARFHNVFGEYTTYDGIRAKYPASICRKVAMAKDGDEIEVWGDGKAVRSFLYIDECIEGVERLMDSDYKQPLNIGSDELISVNDLAQMAIDISGKNLKIKNVPGVQGVRGRNSDNTLIKEVLGWSPTQPLKSGMEKLFSWVNKQVNGDV